MGSQSEVTEDVWDVRLRAIEREYSLTSDFGNVTDDTEPLVTNFVGMKRSSTGDAFARVLGENNRIPDEHGRSAVPWASTDDLTSRTRDRSQSGFHNNPVALSNTGDGDVTSITQGNAENHRTDVGGARISLSCDGHNRMGPNTQRGVGTGSYGRDARTFGGNRGYTNPVFRYSTSVESGCDETGEPVPVKRQRSDDYGFPEESLVYEIGLPYSNSVGKHLLTNLSLF